MLEERVPAARACRGGHGRQTVGVQPVGEGAAAPSVAPAAAGSLALKLVLDLEQLEPRVEGLGQATHFFVGRGRRPLKLLGDVSVEESVALRQPRRVGRLSALETALLPRALLFGLIEDALATAHKGAKLARGDVARAVDVERDPRRLQPVIVHCLRTQLQFDTKHVTKLFEVDAAAVVGVDAPVEFEPGGLFLVVPDELEHTRVACLRELAHLSLTRARHPHQLGRQKVHPRVGSYQLGCLLAGCLALGRILLAPELVLLARLAHVLALALDRLPEHLLGRQLHLLVVLLARFRLAPTCEHVAKPLVLSLRLRFAHEGCKLGRRNEPILVAVKREPHALQLHLLHVRRRHAEFRPHEPAEFGKGDATGIILIDALEEVVPRARGRLVLLVDRAHPLLAQPRQQRHVALRRRDHALQPPRHVALEQPIALRAQIVGGGVVSRLEALAPRLLVLDENVRALAHKVAELASRDEPVLVAIEIEPDSLQLLVCDVGR